MFRWKHGDLGVKDGDTTVRSPSLGVRDRPLDALLVLHMAGGI